jgi:DNA-binding MarR family transcriptional regulator
MQPSSLGTQLRHLIELLDNAVQQAYVDEGLRYRPRYTPIVRALLQHEPCTIGDLAVAATITQPAATQTISLMIKDGLASAVTGHTDARRRMISLTAQGRRLLPKLRRCWQATAIAHGDLERELDFPLSEALARAITALEVKPYGTRIREARAVLREAASKTTRLTSSGG